MALNELLPWLAGVVLAVFGGMLWERRRNASVSRDLPDDRAMRRAEEALLRERLRARRKREAADDKADIDIHNRPVSDDALADLEDRLRRDRTGRYRRDPQRSGDS